MSGNPDYGFLYFMMTPEQHADYAEYLDVPEENTGFTRLEDGNYYAPSWNNETLQNELLAFDEDDGVWGNSFTADYWSWSNVPGVFKP